MSLNAFEALAATQQTSASKAKDRAAERRLAKHIVKSDRDAPMVASPMEKEAWEKQQLLKNFNKAMTQRRQDLLNGKYRDEVKGLVLIIDSLTETSAPALMSYLAKSNWFLHADYTSRMDVLSMVHDAIIRFRIRAGMTPFDDPMWDEPPNAYLIIRKEMTGVGNFPSGLWKQ
jgi:hypothetical protein